MNKAMNMIKKLWNDGGVRRMLLTFAATELVCSGLMVGVFALLGKYTPQVAVGAIVGSVLAVANFAVLSIGVEKSVEALTGRAILRAQSWPCSCPPPSGFWSWPPSYLYC